MVICIGCPTRGGATYRTAYRQCREQTVYADQVLRIPLVDIRALKRDLCFFIRRSTLTTA